MWVFLFGYFTCFKIKLQQVELNPEWVLSAWWSSEAMRLLIKIPFFLGGGFDRYIFKIQLDGVKMTAITFSSKIQAYTNPKQTNARNPCSPLKCPEPFWGWGEASTESQIAPGMHGLTKDTCIICNRVLTDMYAKSKNIRIHKTSQHN